MSFGISAAGWMAGAAVVGAGASVYGASQAGKGGTAPQQRDLNGELTGIASQVPSFNQAGFNNQAQYNGQLGQLNLQNFQNLNQGSFNSGAFDQSNPGFSQFMQDAAANGELQGWSPQQMAAAYSGKQAGDPSLNQYFTGGFGASARDAFNSANPQLQNYTNGLQGTMDQLNARAPGAVTASTYFPNQSQATAPATASQAGNFNAQSFGGTGQNYSGGGYSTIAGPQQARSVSAMAVNPMTGYDQTRANTSFNAIRPQTGFNAVHAQGSDYGLRTAQNQLSQQGPSAIQSQLTQQAKDELALGGSLSSEDTRNAQQAAREAGAARGLTNSNSTIAAEILNRQQFSDQRLQQRQGFAQGVENTNFGQQQQGFANALGVSNASQNYAGMGLQAQQANLGAQLQGNALNFQGQSANLGAQMQGNQLGLQSQIANQGARQASNALGLQGQMANQSAFLQAGLANQASDLTMNNQRFQVGQANQNAQTANNQLGLGYSQLNNSAFQDAQARLQQGSQFNANLGQQNAQYNAGQNNALSQFNATLGQQNNQFNSGQANTAQQFNSQATNGINVFNTQQQQANNNDAWARSMGLGNFLGAQTINPLQYYGLVNGQAPDYTNALLGYGNDVYNTNYNGQAAANISAGNNSAALTGAGLGLLGQSANAYGRYAGTGIAGTGTAGSNSNPAINPATGQPWG